MTQNYCTECGAKIIGDEKFCTQCGMQINPHVNTNNNTSTAYSTPKPYQPPLDSRHLPISTAEYFGIFLLMLIPVVNLILLIVWATGSTNKINLRNFARAALLFSIVVIILLAVFGSIIVGVLVYLFDWYDYSYDYDYNYNYSYNWENIFERATARVAPILFIFMLILILFEFFINVFVFSPLVQIIYYNTYRTNKCTY